MKISEVKHKISKRNIKALLSLALQYKKITTKQLLSAKQPEYQWRLSGKLTTLTGFNTTSKCIVCKSVRKNCDKCFWAYQKEYDDDTNMCSFQKTFEAVQDSQNIVELHKNMNKRGDYILKQLRKAGCIWYNPKTNRWRLSPLVMNNGIK